MKVALCTVPMLGHLMPLLPYAEELMKRGHEVTIFHHDDPKYRNKIEQCGLHKCRSVTYETKNGKWNNAIFESVMSHYHSGKSNNNNNGFDGTTATTVQKKHDGIDLDLLVYDFFAVDSADAADLLNVPSMGVFPNLSRSINPWAASLEQQDTLQWKIFTNFVCNTFEGVLARILWCQRSWTRKSRGLSILHEQDIYPSPYMVRPVIGCSSPYIEFENNIKNVPTSTLYRMVGPSLPAKVDPIQDNLQRWLNQQQTKPIVYIAFGTMYTYTKESVQELQADLMSFKDDISIVWSLPKKEHDHLLDKENLPSNWKIDTFFPQIALFRTGRISVFISHCGSNSVSEALLCGIPIICCPGFADQPANAARLSRAGVGIIRHKNDNGNDGTAVALKQILNNLQSMAARSKALAKQLQSHNGARQAVSWMEEIAERHEQGRGIDPGITKGRWPWWPAAILAPTLPIVISMI